MRPVRSLVSYVAMVFLGGGLLAPWLYWLAQSLSHVFPTPAGNSFHRFVKQALLGVALIGLWPFLRSLGVQSASDIGLARPAGQWPRLAGGFALGFGSLATVALIARAAGARQMKADVDIAGKLLGITAAAVVVAVMEEVLFRGALFGALWKAWHWLFALVLSSIVYAIVHFLSGAKLSGLVDWALGLELLPRMLRGFANWSEVIPAWCCGTARLINGWLAFVVLTLLLMISCRRFRKKDGHSCYGGICY